MIQQQCALLLSFHFWLGSIFLQVVVAAVCWSSIASIGTWCKHSCSVFGCERQQRLASAHHNCFLPCAEASTYQTQSNCSELQRETVFLLQRFLHWCLCHTQEECLRRQPNRSLQLGVEELPHRLTCNLRTDQLWGCREVAQDCYPKLHHAQLSRDSLSLFLLLFDFMCCPSWLHHDPYGHLNLKKLFRRLS